MAALPARAVAMRPAPPYSPDVIKGDETVRAAQTYLKQLGFYQGEADGVLSWPTVQALIKFDASGSGPRSVIADASRPEDVLLARLKIAAATARAPPAAPPPVPAR